MPRSGIRLAAVAAMGLALALSLGAVGPTSGQGTAVAAGESNLSQWSQTGLLKDARLFGHSATLLTNGKILVAGGGGTAGTPLASAELYDPKTGTWSPTGPMKVARMDHTATLLNDGRVLVAGGSDGRNFPDLLASAEIYNPATGTWSDAASLSFRRSAHTANLLTGSAAECGGNCGNVLVTGGDGPFNPLAEVYNPVANAWTATGALANDRSGHSATLISGTATQCAANCGKVLVVGGEPDLFASQGRHTPELYDPKSNSWALTGNEGIRRYLEHTTTLLTNGKVLLAGGNRLGFGSPNVLDDAETFDPATTGVFTATGKLAVARYGQAALRLPSGEVLVTGGRNASGQVLTSTELYDPAAGTWRAGAPLLQPRAKPASFASYSDLPLSQNGPTVTLLAGDAATCGVNCGKVLVVGGSSQRSTELYGIPPAGDDGGGGGGGGSGIGPAPSGSGLVVTPGTGGVQNPNSLPVGPAPPDADPRRAGDLRSCLAGVASHAKVEQSRARRGSARQRKRASSHRKRHARSGRRRCLRLYARTPGAVTGLQARAVSQTKIELSFRAPGTDGSKAPAARSYLVKQSSAPITTKRAFGRAQTLCNGACRFSVTEVGATIKLTVTDLKPHSTHYYAIAARDNVSNKLGPRSATVKAKTP